MNTATITEKYALCMLKEKKTLHEKELSPYLIVSMLVEMMLEESLEITDKNKISLTARIPVESYNKRQYEIIKDMDKEEVSLRYVLSSICYGFSTKKLKSLIELLKESMRKNSLITTESKKGLLGEKEVVKVNESEFMDLIEEIKKELLEEGEGTLTEDAILLASLLNSTRFIKNIFNKYEKEKIEGRLKEIKDTEIAQKVKVAQSVINSMTAMVVATMVNASTPV